MFGLGLDQTASLVFFPGKQCLDSTEVDSLSGKIRDFPAKQKVFFAVNPRSIAAKPGNFQQTQTLPIAEGLLVDPKSGGDFSDG